jgi:hypothetical protein
MTFYSRVARGLILPAAFTIAAALQACGANSSFPVATSDNSTEHSGQGVGVTPVNPPPLQLPPASSPTAAVPMTVAPLWEAPRAAAGISWTRFASILVLTEAPALMKGTNDVQSFCPSYYRLTTDEKVNFWVYLISAVVKYESGFKPLSRMRETGLGSDSVTKLPVYSEGLLQLSYQDGRNYSFCNEFDWSKDRLLGAADPRKTILDPIKNLRCGIRILNKVVGRRNLIAFDSGHYWSTLMPKHSPVHSIQAMTRKISICNL